MPTDQIWLALDEHTDVGVERAEALRWTRDDFADLYRRSVYGSKKKEAYEWADKQVELRAQAYRQAADAAL